MNNGTVFHVNRSLPGQTWEKQDTLCFTPENLDSGQTYQITVEGRFLTSFPYKQVQLQCLEGNQTFTPIIIDIEGSEAQRKGVYLTTLSATPFAWTPDSTSATLRLVSFMQCEKLPGISDIGILIQKQ